MNSTICCSSALLIPGESRWSAVAESEALVIHSDGIRRQVIADRFGKGGCEFQGEMPTRSLPVTIVKAPEQSVSFALTLIDYDAVGAVGVCWVHWLVCNFTERELPENASVQWRSRLTQGVNSWATPLLGEQAMSTHDASAYGGMAPPDRAHRYDLTIYALRDFLKLENGFTWNRLLHEMGPHLLAATTISGVYGNCD